MGRVISDKLACHICGGELWELYEYRTGYAILCEHCEVVGPFGKTLNEAYEKWKRFILSWEKFIGHAEDVKEVLYG